MPTLLGIFLGEFLGTAMLIFLGNGVVANVTFKKTLGRGGGIIAIAFGWAIAVFAGVCIAQIWITGGYINPAVTIGQLTKGNITIVQGMIYLVSQFLGGLFGQILVDGIYWQHIKEEKVSTVLGMHSTGPTHKNIFTNLLNEYLSTIVLVAIVFFSLSSNPSWFGGAPLGVALVVLVIGLSLGGSTGYAINPARDLSPRIIHWIMYKTLYKSMDIDKQVISSNWSYAWIPVIAPLTAGVTMGLIWRLT